MLKTSLARQHARGEQRSISGYFIREMLRAFDSVGAWGVTVIFLIFISWIGKLQPEAEVYFYVHFTYTIVLSMIVSAPINGLLNFHLVDELFIGHYHPVLEMFSGALLLLMPLTFCLALFLFLSFSIKPLSHGIIFAALSTSLTSVWLITNVMTILKLQRVTFMSFLLGLGVAFILIFPSQGIFQEEAVLIGLIVGFSVISFFQYAYILIGHHKGLVFPSFNFLRLKEGALAVTFFFLFFTLMIWIDKIIYWIMPQKTHLLGPFFRYSDYDYPFFIAFSIFSFAYFLIMRRISDLIKAPHKQFSDGLYYNFPLERLDQDKYRLILGYRKIFYSIVFIYGMVTIIALLSVSLGIVRLPWQNPFIFHLLLIATLFLGIFFLNVLILQYLNQYKLLAIICFFLTILNTFLTALSIQLEIRYDGLAFLIVCMIAVVVSYIFIEKILGRWEYVIVKNLANDF